MRVLFLNGGAAIRGRDNAYLSIEDPRAFLSRGGINLGDLLVYDATLKLTDFETASNIQFQDNWRTLDLDRVRHEHDICIIRGSNYLSERSDLGYLVPLIERLDLPVIALGIGAQSATYHRLSLPEGTKRFLQAVAARSHSIGVRGEYSAEVVRDAGVDNVTAIGCPSLFRSLRPSVTVAKRPYSPDLRIGLTLNKYLAGGKYAEDRVKVVRLQREFLVQLAQRGAAAIYSQGERDEFALAMGLEGEKEAALAGVLEKYRLSADDKAVVDLIRHRTKAFLDIESWSRDVAEIDLMIGFRLHGNVMALHQGRPAVFCTYDARIREIAELFHIPFVDVAHFQPIDVQRIYEAADFKPFERAYQVQYRILRDFLEVNRVRHRLDPAKAPDEGRLDTPASPLRFAADAADVEGWYVPELNWMSAEVARLQDRAWNLSLRLAEERAAMADQRAGRDAARS